MCLQDEEFVILLEKGVIPHTRHVRGSNYCLMNVFPDRIPGRAIIVSVVSVVLHQSHITSTLLFASVMMLLLCPLYRLYFVSFFMKGRLFFNIDADR